VAETQVQNASLELGRYAAVLRRRWGVVLLCVILGLGAAFAYAATAARQVTATALVSINVNTSSGFAAQRSASGLIDAPTEEQLARSASVLGAAASAMAQAGYRVSNLDIRQAVQVNVVPEATVANISYTSTNRNEAVVGADAVAAAYIDYRTEQATAKIQRVTRQLEKQREGLRARLQAINNVLARASSGSARAGAALSDRQVVTAQLNSLVAQMNGIDSVDTSGGSVVTSAADNSVSVSPHKQLIIEIGFLLGLVVGLIVAFVVHAADRRVMDPAAVSDAGGAEVLARFPRRSGVVPPSGDDLDEFRSLRERVLASLSPTEPFLTVVDLTRAGVPNDLAVNLAYSLAETGRRVHLALPGHDSEFAQQVSQALEAQPREDEMDSRIPGPVLTLPVLRESVVVPDPDITIIAAPPQATRSLMLASARQGRFVLFVVARRRTRKRDISSASHELRSVGATVLGSALISRRRRLNPSLPSASRELVRSRSRG
jgi:uncharacterized protein involved in exopolysaccharide biosynthesis